MKIHYLQHAAFEGPGCIEDWARDKVHTLARTQLYQDEGLPGISDMDCLIILGGPMGIDDTHRCPWLNREKAFIRAAIENGCPVLGICLGAQLIAGCLGARIMKNRYREIGWFPITRAAELSGSTLAGVIPEHLEAFHWHGDTFELPPGAVRIAGSQACINQGFVYGERVVALQFHLESTAAGARLLIDNCADEITEAPYIQTAEQMLADASRFGKINELMYKVLDYQESLVKNN